ncbi:MAG: hypothetical protein H7273_09785, partial [Polaromonas sp.]|nr:hypothetical protein [Polaromonas sp.]
SMQRNFTQYPAALGLQPRSRSIQAMADLARALLAAPSELRQEVQESGR